jgi:hypothetical protein
LPIGFEQSRIRDRIDVVSERKRHDVGFESVDHRARLFA